MSILKGWIGEKAATFGIWAGLDKRYYPRFHDIIVPTSNGTTQIDHIIVSRVGIFVIETKNYSGWIFGSEKNAQWTQSLYGKKSKFQNPLRQNYRHIKCLSEYTGIPQGRFKSIVFFIGDCTLKTELPPNVINRGLIPYIKSFVQLSVSEEEAVRAMGYLAALQKNPELTKKSHLESLQKRHNSNTTCPKCGGSLVTRTARKGKNAGGQFLACSSFPKCRYSKSL